jgi:hypothetical protein
MKRISFFLFLLLLIGCSSDDTPTEKPTEDDIAQDDGNDDATDDPNDGTDPSDDTTDQSSQEIFDGLIVEGGSKQPDMPPTPNEAISLELPEGNLLGAPGEGFSVPLITEDSAIGAYLQITTNNGGVADGYYDIDLTSNTQSDKSRIKNLPKHLFPKGASKMEEDLVLDVDWNDTVQPGEFCFLICVYDAEGNISAPVERCVNVTEWGGDIDFLGIWNALRIETSFEGQVETLFNYGEEFCVEEVDECITYEYEILTLAEDGTFTTTFKIIFDIPDIGSDLEQIIDFQGNWAFDAATNQFILAIYSFSLTDSISGEMVEDYPVGEAIVELFENVDLSGDILRLKYDDGIEGNSDFGQNDVVKVYQKQ